MNKFGLKIEKALLSTEKKKICCEIMEESKLALRWISISLESSIYILYQNGPRENPQSLICCVTAKNQLLGLNQLLFRQYAIFNKLSILYIKIHIQLKLCVSVIFSDNLV